jgi:SAM-dependent methyltransferase
MAPEAAASPTVFDEYVEDYDAACDCGLRYAGESRDYFARCRVAYTARVAGDADAVETVLDFGCGPGHAAPHLWRAFPGAAVVGIDNASAMIAAAQRRYGGERARFVCGDLTPGFCRADLAYCNGVFHHIPPAEREGVARGLLSCLRPGGRLAFWENNPWNPGTRLVMSRIPFDRDAIPLSYRESQALLRTAGFDVLGTSFHFYFPSPLKALRVLEPLLRGIPLGGQYCVLAQRPLA